MENEESGDVDTMRLQLQQAIEGLRQQQTHVVQASGFFITADVLLLTYGFSQRNASGLLAASLTPVAMLVATWLILTTGLPYAYVAIRLERELLPNWTPLVATIMKMRQPAVYKRLDVALGIDDAGGWEEAARVARRSGTGIFRSAMSWLLLAWFLVQVVIFIVALIILDYQMA